MRDTVESCTRRLHAYRSGIAPWLKHYRSRNLLLSIDATPAPEEVVTTLMASQGWFSGS